MRSAKSGKLPMRLPSWYRSEIFLDEFLVALADQ